MDGGRALWMWGATLTALVWFARSILRSLETGRRLPGVLRASRLGRRPWALATIWFLFTAATAWRWTEPTATLAILAPAGLLTTLGLASVLRWPGRRCNRARWVAAACAAAAAGAFAWFVAGRFMAL